MDANSNPRFHMWCRLVPNYIGLSSETRIKVKNNLFGPGEWGKMKPSFEDYARAETNYNMHNSEKMNSLVDCCVATTSAPTPPCPYNIKEKAMDKTCIERDYLRGRMYNIRDDATLKMEKTFGLIDDDTPRTPKEVVDRILSGKVVYSDDEQFNKKPAWSRDPFADIRWRDPAMKEDKDGFAKAMSDLEAAETPVYDAINIEDPKDALDAVQAFEKATLH